jgi:hypothetical protein
MEEKMDFIKGKETFVMVIVLIGGILLMFVGGLIGSTVLGWILFVLGLLLTGANLYFFFSNYRDIYETKRQWAYIGAGVLSLLVIVALVAMFVSLGKAGNRNALPIETAAPEIQVTEVAADAATTTATPSAAEATTAPTEASSASGAKPVFVCLNEKAPYGLNIRVEPKVNSAYGGLIEWGVCFTVDGKAAGYPGWYHVTAGQEGSIEGFSVGVNESKYLLWVDGTYLESFGVDLDALPELDVPAE